LFWTWQELQEEVNSVNEEKVALDSRIQELQQEIQDGLDARKIHEKKGMTVVRDLKKQLHAEKKRVEKLQERLQELLADSSRGRQCKSSTAYHSYITLVYLLKCTCERSHFCYIACHYRHLVKK
jgi:predicted RNase H-like nuclease (RuvC/YqgF family)